MSSNREETYFDSAGVEWYRESGAPAWPSRVRAKSRPSWDPEQQVTDILSDLKSLERETDPAAGEASSIDKDMKAQRALRLAGNLVEIVAGWAIDHQAGLIKDGLRPTGWVPEALRERFSERILSVNQHEHERRGGHPNFQLNDIEARELLRALLEFNSGAFPDVLQGHIGPELDRIAFGEPSAVFQVPKNSNKRSLKSVALQAWTVSMVAYRMEMGASWEDATQAVADRFGKDFNTIKGWEANAKKKFGKLEIEMMKGHARKAAQNERAERDAALANKPLARPGLYGAGYDDDALAAIVVEYNASLRE